mgnify:CR=1 FL=1
MEAIQQDSQEILSRSKFVEMPGYDKHGVDSWFGIAGQEVRLISDRKEDFFDHKKSFNGVLLGVNPRNRTLTFFQQDSGKLIDVLLDQIGPENIKALVPGNYLKWSNQIGAHDSTEELKKSFEEAPLLDAIFFGETADENKKFAVSGKMSYKEIRPDYFAFEIIDSDGKTHLIDPNLLSKANILSALPEKISQEHFQIKSHEELRIIDANHEKRALFVEELVASGNIFDNPDFYKYYQEHFNEVGNILERWYGEKGKDIVTKVNRELGVDFLCLALDPGIANRLDDFIEFVQKNLDLRFQSPDSIRKSFSDHLGKETVYRALMLTDDELENIRGKQMLPSGMNDKSKFKRDLTEMFSPFSSYQLKAYPTTPMQEIMARLSPFKVEGTTMMPFYFMGNSNILSVSGYPEVGLSIAYHDGHQYEIPGKNLYLFELNIPMISLIKQEGLFEINNDGMDLKIGDKIVKSGDPNKEMFVFYGLDPNSVKGVKKIDSPPPKYKWVTNVKS